MCVCALTRCTCNARAADRRVRSPWCAPVLDEILGGSDDEEEDGPASGPVSAVSAKGKGKPDTYLGVGSTARSPKSPPVAARDEPLPRHDAGAAGEPAGGRGHEKARGGWDAPPMEPYPDRERERDWERDRDRGGQEKERARDGNWNPPARFEGGPPPPLRPGGGPWHPPPAEQPDFRE